MPRFLTTPITVLIIGFAALGSSPIAHAQTITGTDAATAYTTCINTPGNTPAQCQQAYDAYKAAIGTSVPDTPTDYHPDDTDSAYNTVMQKIMSLFAWLLGVAAVTLDYSVYYTVVSMGGYIHNLTAIGIAWRVLRDVGNIMLIFGFLAVGITVILNVDWYGDRKKMLPMLLVAAVFLNFSLFFSEAIIDAGNLFATQFYTQINGGQTPSPNFLSNVTVSNEGISNKIMSQLGLQTIYGEALTNTDVFKGSTPFYVGFMGILLFITAAFVMFSLAFILIARFVALVFLIILAPVGFAGLAVPALAHRASQWWDSLFKQTLTAPVLLLLLYIALTVITDAQFLSFGGGPAGPDFLGWVGVRNLTGFASMMLSFLVAMGLLLLVVIQSKNLSAFGAGWATKTAGKLSFGATATLGRSTLGWGSQRISQSLTSGRLAKVGRAPIVGRALVGAVDRGAKASFDVRGTGALKNFPGGGIDAGAAQKGGFREWEKTKTKEREEYAKRFGQTPGEKKQQAEEEGRVKLMEQTVKEIESQNKDEMEELIEKQKKELEQPTNDVAAAQEKLAELKKQQSGGGTVSAGELTAAENELKAAQDARKQKQAEQKKEQDELRKTHEELVGVQKEEVAAHKEEVARLKQAPQAGYAAGLNLYIDQDKGGFLRGAVNFINPQRNAKAAENILKEARKSRSEKDLEKIKKFLEDSDKPKKEEKEEGPKIEAPK